MDAMSHKLHFKTPICEDKCLILSATLTQNVSLNYNKGKLQVTLATRDKYPNIHTILSNVETLRRKIKFQ